MKQKKYFLCKKGFTLIELLIVIAIIGILASIVLVSLSNAKQKSREAAIIAEARQMAALMHRQYADIGSYTGLQVNAWIGSTHTTCAARGFSGSYSAQLISLCEGITDKLGSVSLQLLIGNTVSTANSFAIMVKTTPANGTSNTTWFCIGSSGRTYLGPYDNTAPGCYNNP